MDTLRLYSAAFRISLLIEKLDDGDYLHPSHDLMEVAARLRIVQFKTFDCVRTLTDETASSVSTSDQLESFKAATQELVEVLSKIDGAVRQEQWSSDTEAHFDKLDESLLTLEVSAEQLRKVAIR